MCPNTRDSWPPCAKSHLVGCSPSGSVPSCRWATQSGGQQCRSPGVYSWQPKSSAGAGGQAGRQAQHAVNTRRQLGCSVQRCYTRHKRGQHKARRDKTPAPQRWRAGGLAGWRASKRVRGHVRPVVLICRICVHGQIDINTPDMRRPQSARGVLLLITAFSAAREEHLRRPAEVLNRRQFRATSGTCVSQGPARSRHGSSCLHVGHLGSDITTRVPAHG